MKTKSSMYLTKSLALNQNPRGAIVGTRGSLLGAIIRIKNRQEILLGRDAAQCSLVVTGRGISRKHCRILHDSGQNTYYLKDYSLNGTYINGKKMKQDCEYKAYSGDEIWLGSREQVIKLG